jgi:hypothetical protein
MFQNNIGSMLSMLVGILYLVAFSYPFLDCYIVSVGRV